MSDLPDASAECLACDFSLGKKTALGFCFYSSMGYSSFVNLLNLAQTLR